MEKPLYRIDGRRCADFTGLIAEIDRVFGDVWGHGYWKGNLDAFNDMLDWPNEGEPYILVWEEQEAARRQLAHPAMAGWLRDKLGQCRPGYGQAWRKELADAERGWGRTLFDWVVEIIREHPQIELRLE
jgi:hypothetical protein